MTEKRKITPERNKVLNQKIPKILKEICSTETKEVGCPPDRSSCFAEDDISGTDCIFLKDCYPDYYPKESR